jgi:hypothetical protein
MSSYVVSVKVSILVAVVLATLSSASGQTRTWTDTTGAFTVEAEFVDLVDGKVRLKRADGRIVTVTLDQLSEADQQLARQAGNPAAATVTVDQLAGKPEELQNDDGTPAGKKSFPRGIASAFTTSEGTFYLTSIRIHGGRYGYPKPPDEDFHVSLCDKDFNHIADFPFPYSKFPRAAPDWVTLRMRPTQVPREFIICLNFNPERTKGVYVSHDAEGKSLVGLPGKPAGSFTGGDWMIRPVVDTVKP